MRRKHQPRDYFGNLIQPGDRYFYGSPAIRGVVVKITGRSLLLDVGISQWPTLNANKTMICRSPATGVCLDRVPNEEGFWA